MSYKMDPNDFRICPYDKSHVLAAYKFQTHLIKCKKSHPELAKTFEKCPFNATHLFLGCDKDEHLLNCPDNNLLQRMMQRNAPEEVRCKVPPVSSAAVVNNVEEDDWDIQEPQISINIKRGESSDRNIAIAVPKKHTYEDDNDIEIRREPAKKFKSLGRGILRK